MNKALEGIDDPARIEDLVTKADDIIENVAVAGGKSADEALDSLDDAIKNYDGPADQLIDDLASPANPQIDEIVQGLVCSFSANTPVATSQGLLPIASIRVGDEVLGFDEGTGEIDYFPVTANWSHDDPVIINLTIDGELIETTPEHPFYIDGTWVAAEDLEVGMTVTSAGDNAGVISATERIEQTQEMFNLTVDEAHTYFVGEGQWLVHNACSTELDKALKGKVGDNLQAHHLIPGQLESHPLIAKAMTDPTNPWKIDGELNGMHLPSTAAEATARNLPLHNTNHGVYTESVRRRLNELVAEEDLYKQTSPNNVGWTQAELIAKLDGVADEFRQLLSGMDGTKRVPKAGDPLPVGWP